MLYHGTDQSSAQRIVADGVDVYAGRREVDFGQGFYTTTSLKQVRDWALSRASKVGERPAVIRLAIDRLELRNLRSLVFIRSSMDSTDFWSFVTHCRKGKSLSPITAEDYDVVYGPVAAKWGPIEYGAISDFDQVSFHGNRASELLRDARSCDIGAMK